MKKRFLEKFLVPIMCTGLAVAMLTPAGITAFADDEAASESTVTSPAENDVDTATDSVMADAETAYSTVGEAADAETSSEQTQAAAATPTPTPELVRGDLYATNIDMDLADTPTSAISLDKASIPGLKGLYFAVWSARDGQDDIIWLKTIIPEIGNLYAAEVDISDFSPKSGLYDGTYNVHCYAFLADGTMEFINSTTFEVKGYDKINAQGLVRGTLHASDSNEFLDGSNIYISDEHIPNLKWIYFAIWSDRDGQDDLIWKKADIYEDGLYSTQVTTSDFSPKSGLYDCVYNVHCYAVLKDGTMEFINSTTFNMTGHEYRNMYRLYNPNSGEHFFTLSGVEQEKLVSLGWKYEGIAWKAPTSGTPIYRLYNPNAGDHHYTGSEAEKNNLVKAGWKYEGIAWYSAPSSNGKPLYRLYNPNCTGAGAHHYTASTTERDNLVKAGWKYEGIGWYGV